MIAPFAYDALPGRVVFGEGTLAKLGAEMDALGLARAIVLTTPEQTGQGDEVASLIGARLAGRFGGAGCTCRSSVAEARRRSRRAGADACVAVGGGSTTGLAKAIALGQALPDRRGADDLRRIGDDADLGPDRRRRQNHGHRPARVAAAVIYDPGPVARPCRRRWPRGMNAIAHCVEALYSQTANPVTSLMAEDGIRALAEASPRRCEARDEASARAQVLMAPGSAAPCSAPVGMALHHKLCHTLGGASTCRTPRSIRSSSRMRPRSTPPAAPEATARIARALGGRGATRRRALFDLASRSARRRGCRTSGCGSGSRPRRRISPPRIRTIIRARRPRDGCAAARRRLFRWRRPQPGDASSRPEPNDKQHFPSSGTSSGENRNETWENHHEIDSSPQPAPLHAGAAAALARAGRGGPAVARGRQAAQDRLRQPEDRPARGLRRGRRLRHRRTDRSASATASDRRRRKRPVEILLRDSQSKPSRAAEVAASLIKDDNVDLMLVSSTPETTNPVSDQCELNEVPCISTVAPWQPWFFTRGGKPETGFNWTYHFFWGLEDIIAVFNAMWASVSDQQGRRRPVAQRRRRQRLERRRRSASRQCCSRTATRSSIPAATRTSPTISRRRSRPSRTPMWRS